ncbi:MAG: hypothetical protein NT076_02630 [Candidatus Pacearchaeota archaeon]|nr:hypothetical protein [Candidatus Pacearchaeota archaeon]
MKNTNMIKIFLAFFIVGVMIFGMIGMVSGVNLIPPPGPMEQPSGHYKNIQLEFQNERGNLNPLDNSHPGNSVMNPTSPYVTPLDAWKIEAHRLDKINPNLNVLKINMPWEDVVNIFNSIIQHGGDADEAITYLKGKSGYFDKVDPSINERVNELMAQLKWASLASSVLEAAKKLCKNCKENNHDFGSSYCTECRIDMADVEAYNFYKNLFENVLFPAGSYSLLKDIQNYGNPNNPASVNSLLYGFPNFISKDYPTLLGWEKGYSRAREKAQRWTCYLQNLHDGLNLLDPLLKDPIYSSEFYNGARSFFNSIFNSQ